MAVRDYYHQLAEDKALPASATTEYSTNEVDFGAGKDAWGAALANPNIGQGSPIYFNFVMTSTGAGATGSPTLTLNLVAGAATAPTTIIQIIASALAKATLVAGYKISVPIQAFPATARFLRLQVVAGSAGYDTSPTYSAWLDVNPIADA